MNRNLVAVAVIALVAGALLHWLIQGSSKAVPVSADTSTAVTLLKDKSGNCTLDRKENLVLVARGNAVHWDVTNNCSAPYKIQIGNFRADQASSNPTSCDNETEGQAEFPFANRDRTIDSLEPGKTKTITLAGARNSTSAQLEYYFDICRSDTTQTVKLEPRLVIE